MPHAPQVAFAFLANISDKYQGSSMRQIEIFKGRGKREQRRYAGGVIRNPGSVELSPLLADIQGSVGWKNRVEVRADREKRMLRCGPDAENVPDFIASHIFHAQR